MYHHTKDVQISDRLGNNEVLKTLTKILTFVDANEGSTIALREHCSGKLKSDYLHVKKWHRN